MQEADPKKNKNRILRALMVNYISKLLLNNNIALVLTFNTVTMITRVLMDKLYSIGRYTGTQ